MVFFFQKSIKPSSLIYTLPSFRLFDLHRLYASKIINVEFYLFPYLYVWFLICVTIRASRNTACHTAKFSPYLFLKDDTHTCFIHHIAISINTFPHETKKEFYTYICKCKIQKQCSPPVLRYF